MMGKVIMSGIVPQLVVPRKPGIQASELAVGSTVKLMENGAPVDYLVVHRGLPSSLYDNSCDGLWLLRKNIHSDRVWDSTNNDYANSDIHVWLNGTFFNTLGAVEQVTIKQVKIPYRRGSGIGTTVTSGASGLSAKAFLLSATEVGYNYAGAPKGEGVELAYFYGCSDYDADPKREAMLNGSTHSWSVRSPNTSEINGVTGVNYLNSAGMVVSGYCTNIEGKRPALILPSTAIFDEETLILKGVA